MVFVSVYLVFLRVLWVIDALCIIKGLTLSVADKKTGGSNGSF